MKKAWVTTLNMGYGHQRTAHTLKFLAEDIVICNEYKGIPGRDSQIWKKSRSFYEFISRFKKVPILGGLAFSAFDSFQAIDKFYPKRDLSKPSFTLKQTQSFIKKGWGEDLIEKLKKYPLPMINTFFTPAFMAEFFNYPCDIFCVICDADVARTWAPFNSKKSRIKYFAPNKRVVERLKFYGVDAKNIFLTGYPLPLENIGDESMKTLKEDLRHRMLNLDPYKSYLEKYQGLVEQKLGRLPEKSNHPLTIMFAVGGAGAQKEIGVQIFNSLKEKIKNKKVRLILVAGVRKRVRDYFEENTQRYENVSIIFGESISEYFDKFNKALRKTDILWTKPSELSFYSALGVPIIIAPTIGSQEEFNERWLTKSGFGILQENPEYTSEWMFDWLEKGYFAEIAMEGFIEGRQLGSLNIEKIALKCGS